MGLSVLEAANTGIKYLDSDKMPGWIYHIVLSHQLSYTFLSPNSRGTFVLTYTIRPQAPRVVRSEFARLSRHPRLATDCSFALL